MAEPARYLSMKDAAEKWQISRQQVYNLIKQGKLGCIRFGRTIRIRPDQIAAYEEANIYHADNIEIPIADCGSDRPV